MVNETNKVTGKAALLMAAASNVTENCACCGKFLPAADRLPVVLGYAHFACLATKAVR